MALPGVLGRAQANPDRSGHGRVSASSETPVPQAAVQSFVSAVEPRTPVEVAPGVVKLALLWVLGLSLAAGNLYSWHWTVRRGDDRFREYVERAFDVTIGKGHRGHWRVSSGRSRLGDVGIELLQLAYYMAAFLVWGAALIGCVGLMSWATR